MSSLAHMALAEGKTVGGSDRADSSAVKALAQKGCHIVIGHFPESVQGYDLVVYTAAVSQSSPELFSARRLGIPTLTRGEYLGAVMQDFAIRIGVSGTHGKTSTTTLLSHIALAANVDPTVMNGARAKTLNGEAYRIGADKRYFLYEACEYKASFHDFYPTTAIITNIELDHTDCYASLDDITEAFRKSLSCANIAVVNYDDPAAMRAVSDFQGKTVTFSLNSTDADYAASDIEPLGQTTAFTLYINGKAYRRVQLSLIGRFNVANALAALAAAHQNGISPDIAAASLQSFEAPDRRFEVIHRGKVLLCDDYAHHPSEIEATLKSAKALLKEGGRLIVIFQSHTYTRTHDLFDDFVKALRLADLVYMPDIYAARETDTLGVSSETLCRAIGTNATYLKSFDSIAHAVFSEARENDVILTMGAGDVFAIGRTLKTLFEQNGL